MLTLLHFDGCLITHVNSGVAFQLAFLKWRLTANAARHPPVHPTADAIFHRQRRPQALGSKPGLPPRPVYAQNGLVITPLN